MNMPATVGPRVRKALLAGLGGLCTVMFVASCYPTVLEEGGSMSLASRRISGNGLRRSLGSSDDNTCFLKNGAKPEKVQPSITTCYMHTADGCCAPAHDATIGEALGFLVPEVCADDDSPRPPAFDSLEEWYCLGCDPEADNYIDWYFPSNKSAYTGDVLVKAEFCPGTTPCTKTVAGDPANVAAFTAAKAKNNKMSSMYTKADGKFGELRVCKSFANKLMYLEEEATERADQSQMLDGFDGCALTLNLNFFSTEGDAGVEYEGAFPSQYWTDLVPDEPTYIWDSSGGASDGALKVDEEYMFMAQLRPTYYNRDNFEISWHWEDSATCFGAASGVGLAPTLMLLMALLAHALA